MGADQANLATQYRNEYVPPAIRPYKQNVFGGADELSDDDTDVLVEQNPHQIGLGIADAEKRFDSEELNKIKKEFERLSKDDVIGKRKLLEYFKMVEIQDTYLSDEVFFMIKNSSQANTPVTYSKFINFVSVVARGTPEEKLQLLYTFFDKSVDSKITKDDLKAHISGTIISMQSVRFDADEIERLKHSVTQSSENEID
jgi:Ca2+-binding EF-hand superfamily protein